MRGLRPAELPDLLKVVKLVIGRTGFERSCVSCRLSDFLVTPQLCLLCVGGRSRDQREGCVLEVLILWLIWKCLNVW